MRCLPSARREVGEWGSAWGAPGGPWGLFMVLSVFLPCQVLTTIEGIIDRAVAGLEQDQPARRVRLERGTPQGWAVLGVSVPCPWCTQGCWTALSVPQPPLAAALGCPQQLSPPLGCPHFKGSVVPCPLPGNRHRGGQEDRRVHWQAEAAEGSQHPFHLCECSGQGGPGWLRLQSSSLRAPCPAGPG